MSNASDADRRQSGLVQTFVPVLERWPKVVMLVMLLALVGGVVTYLLPRKYEAHLSLMTISNPKIPNVAGNPALAALLGSAATTQMGMQATPALVVKLTELPGVLRTIAMRRADSTGPALIVERVARKTIAEIPYDRIEPIMLKYIDATYDRTTGIIDVKVVHRDSAIARIVALRMVDATRETFVRTVRAQATELRRSEERRVDSAASQLHRVEDELLEHARANRAVAPYSVASLEHERIQRRLSIAQNIYSQAVNDREAAIAKELEDTPAVVIVDDLPTRLPRRPRHLAVIVVLTAFLGFIAVVLGILLREAVRARLARGDEAALRTMAILRRLPLVGSRFHANRSGETPLIRRA